jgi:hypothetical protein
MMVSANSAPVQAAALIECEVMKISPIGANGGDVSGLTRVGGAGVAGDEQVPPIQSPVHLDGRVRTKECDLEEFAAVDSAREERPGHAVRCFFI